MSTGADWVLRVNSSEVTKLDGEVAKVVERLEKATARAHKFNEALGSKEGAAAYAAQIKAKQDLREFTRAIQNGGGTAPAGAGFAARTAGIGRSVAGFAGIGGIGALATRGFSGTVEGNRLANEVTLLSREVAGAFMPAMKKLTSILQSLRRGMEALPGWGQDAVMYGGLAYGGYKAYKGYQAFSGGAGLMGSIGGAAAVGAVAEVAGATVAQRAAAMGAIPSGATSPLSAYPHGRHPFYAAQARAAADAAASRAMANATGNTVGLAADAATIGMTTPTAARAAAGGSRFARYGKAAGVIAAVTAAAHVATRQSEGGQSTYDAMRQGGASKGTAAAGSLVSDVAYATGIPNLFGYREQQWQQYMRTPSTNKVGMTAFENPFPALIGTKLEKLFGTGGHRTPTIADAGVEDIGTAYHRVADKLAMITAQNGDTSSTSSEGSSRKGLTDAIQELTKAFKEQVMKMTFVQ